MSLCGGVRTCLLWRVWRGGLCFTGVEAGSPCLEVRAVEQLFSPSPPPDPYNRAASHVDGAASLLVGFAANESIRTQRLVHTDDLFRLPAAG